MVVFNIDVKIKETGGSKAVKTGLEQMQKTAAKTQKVVERIGRRVRLNGIKRAQSELQKTSRIASQLRTVLGQTFGTIGLGFAIKKVAELADSYVNLQNRLRIVTKGTADLKAVTEELFQVADETRSSYEGTAELFTRVSIATKNLGRSQREVINFTRTLNKAVILSGTTAKEARNGIIQLSQGLASGALRGDELRSVLEQLPKVSDAISTAMGITRGELRKMGEAGKISADIIIDAMAKAADQIDKDFATTIPTISQAFTQLTNQIIKLLGEVNEGSGIFSGFARGVQFVAQNLRTIIKVLTAIAAGFVAIKIQAALAGVSVAGFGVKMRGALLSAKGGAAAVGVLSVGLAELTSWLTKSTSALDALEERVERMTELEKLEANFERMNTRLQAWRVSIAQGAKQSDSMRKAFEKLDLAVFDLSEKIRGLKDGSTAASNAEKKLTKAYEEGLSALNKQIILFGKHERKRELLIQQAKVIAKIEKEGGSALSDARKKQILADLKRVRSMRELRETLDGLTRKEDERKRQLELLAQIEKTHPELIDKIRAARQRLFDQETKDILPTAEFEQGAQVLIQSLERIAASAEIGGERAKAALAGKLKGALLAGVEGADTLKEKIDRITIAAKAAGVSADVMNKAIEDVLGKSTEQVYAEELEDLGIKLKARIIDQREFNRLVREAGPVGQKAATKLSDGFQNAFDKMHDEANDFAAVGEEIVELFAEHATRAINEFVDTGKFKFREFASALLKDIAKIIIRLLVVKALSALGGVGGQIGATVGSAAGAALDKSQQTQARAEGGPVEKGRPYLVGEEGPEIIVPKQAGTVMPNSAVMTAPTPPPPEVNIQVTNVTDPNEIPAALDNGDYDKQLVNAITRNRDLVKRGLQ